MEKYHCEYCGEECEEFGDVRGAIVCLACMEDNPECHQIIQEMEKELRELHAGDKE